MEAKDITRELIALEQGIQRLRKSNNWLKLGLNEGDFQSQEIIDYLQRPLGENVQLDVETENKIKAAVYLSVKRSKWKPRKIAKQYIQEYLEEYQGIKDFMEKTKESAKEKGYVETLFNRRRYIPELKSNNYMVRQFGERAAMNTPIQGTAADIMKIAMIKVKEELENKNLKSKIVLQVHDEMMIEAPIEEAEIVKNIVKESMESAVTLKIPLIAEVSEAENWYECK